MAHEPLKGLTESVNTMPKSKGLLMVIEVSMHQVPVLVLQ